jgi:hypothetical protein
MPLMAPRRKWHTKATGVILLICAGVFVPPLLIGVWLPDVVFVPRSVLAERRSPDGEVVRVIQYWNRVDFYSTELHYIPTTGLSIVSTLDGDDYKHWHVPLAVDWKKKQAKVILGHGRLRTVDLVSGDWDR